MFKLCFSLISSNHGNLIAIKVGTHDGTSPCNKSQGLVASCELAIFAIKSSRRDQNRLVPRIQTGFEFVGLVVGTKGRQEHPGTLNNYHNYEKNM